MLDGQKTLMTKEEQQLLTIQKLKSCIVRYMACMNVLLKDVSNDRIRNIIHKQDEDGNTPLHYGDVRIRNIINKQDGNGNTPLHYAVKIWPQNIVKDLLRFGADVSIQNKHDQIPLRKIPMETINEFLDEHCMETKGLIVLEENEEDKDEAYAKLIEDYYPRYMTIYDKQQKYSITFDYEFLTPTQYSTSNDKHDIDNAPQSETSVLTAICNSMKHRELLLHPVIKSFVWIKWNLISRYYSRNLRIQLLLLYFLTWYIFSQFAGLEWLNRCEFFQKQKELSHGVTDFCGESDRRNKVIANHTYGEKENMTVGERLKSFFAGRTDETIAGTFGDPCMYTHGAYICFIPLALFVFYWMLKDIKRLFFSPNPYAHGGKPNQEITFYSVVMPLVLDLINVVLILSVLVFSGGILWIVITVLYVISCYFEIRQFLASPIVHFKRSTNWGDSILYVLIAFVVYVPNKWISDPVYYSQSETLKKVCDVEPTPEMNIEGDVSVKRGIAGFLIVLSWTRFIFHVAKNPGRITERFNKYAMMYKRVATSFLNILMVYSFFIVSFAMGFYIMFHNDIGEAKLNNNNNFTSLSSYVFFETPYESLVKTVAMFIGEVDFNNIPIGLSYGRRDGNVSATLGYLYFLAFMLMVTLVLMNLLNGLAVTDITAIIQESETLHQISMINILEEFDDHALNTRKSLDMISKCCPCLKANLLKFLDVSSDFLLFHSNKALDTKEHNLGESNRMERNTKIKTLPDWHIPKSTGCVRWLINSYLGTSNKDGCEVIVAEARKKLLLRQKAKMDKRAKEKKEARER